MCIYTEPALQNQKRSKLLDFLGKSEDLASLGPHFHRQLPPGAKQQSRIKRGLGSAVHPGLPRTCSMAFSPGLDRNHFSPRLGFSTLFLSSTSPLPQLHPSNRDFTGLGETGVISRVSCTGPTSCVQAAPRGCQSAFPKSNKILCEPSTPNENDQALPNSSLPGTTERAPQSIWRSLCLAE